MINFNVVVSETWAHTFEPNVIACLPWKSFNGKDILNSKPMTIQ